MIKIRIGLEPTHNNLIKLLALFDGDDIIVEDKSGTSVWGKSGGVQVDDPDVVPTLWVEDIHATGEDWCLPLENIKEIVLG